MKKFVAWLAAGVAPLAIAMPAAAQTVFAPADERPEGDEVTVTGSRVPGRTVADSPVPIDVISGETLRRSGQTETNKLLNQLVPSFNFPQPSLTDGTDSLRPATLRGLAPDQTLVLVNGKRRHQAALINLNGSVGRGSTAVDLNEIPAIAIDRIEVLRDGASSQYGSDAIAGVINLQLAKREGVNATATYGRYQTTLPGVFQVAGVALGANGQPAILTPGGGANDILQLVPGPEVTRDDGGTLTLATRFGLPLGPDAFFSFSAQYRDRNPTQRSGADPRRQYPLVGGLSDPRELTIDRFTHGYGDGQVTDFNFFFNTGADIGPDAQVYAFGSYGIRDGIGAGFYRRANDARNRDFSASTTSFVPFYPNGFLPRIQSMIEDAAGSVGIKGKLAGWNGDLSLTAGSNRLDYQTIDSFNVSLGGANSPRRFDSGGLFFRQTTVNLDFNRKFEVSGLKGLGIAFGGEYRDENFAIRQGSVSSYINGPFSAAPFNGAGGAQVFPGFRPSNAIDVSRNSFAGYVEIDVDVTKDFIVQGAGRYENYSDFGETWNGKIAARWEIFPGVAIRGSASSGFRAPSLAQQFFATTSTNNTVVNGVAQLIEVGTFPATSPVATALGGRQLKPERALNLAGGITLTPIAGLSITADYYNITIRDRVLLTENLTGAGVVNLLVAAGIGNVTSARFFVNGADTRTEGVDIVGTYRLPEFGAGKFVLTAGYNYNDTRIISRAVLPSLPGLILFGRQESFRLTDGQPRSKLNLTLDWELGRWGATARTNRFGTVWTASNGALTAPLGTVAGDFQLTPKWVTDFELRYQPVNALTLAVGADNILDEYPDRLPVGGATGAPGFTPNSYFLPYSSLSP
ncbi:MAG: TonB-dependent receptor, partial [Sphingomonas sp.]|nr:TonB-dependent receptor [Sphingomonas sp.]